MNPASDPFMTNQLRGMSERPRVRVRILGATNLPQGRASNVSTYATCMAKNKKTSMFRTQNARDSFNPVWNEGGQMVMRWVPGDALLFRIFDKDHSGLMSGLLSSEVPVAQCEIHNSDYFPDGIRGGWLQLTNAAGYPIEGAMLQVEVLVQGVAAKTMMQKIRSCCDCSYWDLNRLKHTISLIPETVINEWYSIIGEPASDRHKGDMGILIAIPLITFLFLAWFGWILNHINEMAIVMIDGLAFMIALGCIVLGVTTHKTSKTPFFAIGCLMMIAVFLGIYACANGWNEEWRQWWWMHTGNKMGATAGTPAEARSDSAVVTFDTVKNGTAWTSVDSNRAAGYRRGDIYCAAPILDPTTALGDIERVNFWAIGINCCNDFGSFTCDSSREVLGGGVGVVMKGGGMPCYDCHANEFRLAALKAAGVNGMVSAPGALYVRYVSNSDTIENLYLSKCVFSFFWSLILGLLFFSLIGFLTNYKGWGRPGHFPLYNLLTPAHKRHPTQAQMEGQSDQSIIDEKKWTLVLAPSNDGQGVKLAAMKPEDYNTL